MYNNRRQNEKENRRQTIERLMRGHPDHQPPHLLRNHNHYLVSAACYEHRPHLLEPARRDDLQSELWNECHENGVWILAWTILTNHYHLVVEVEDFENIGRALRKVHGRTSFNWNGNDGRRGRKIWYRYTDRALRSDRHMWTSVNYVHYNPVKHRLVRTPYDWQHSSVHSYRKLFGREWLQDLWMKYPVRDFGMKWDR